MSKDLLLIFTRNPELGKVKTRLAKTIGDQKALEIYTFLLQRTKTISAKVQADKRIYYSEKIREHDLWNTNLFDKKQQFGKDLGARMERAFQEGFADGYDKIIIIGSDLYDLTSEIIDSAFLALDENEVVIGPAEDGGYYLLGMKRLYPALFHEKPWGTSTVLEKTLADLNHKKVHLLGKLNDVDEFKDIQHHPAFQKFLN